MANVVVLSGRIANDVQLGFTDNNVPKLNLNLAVRHEYKTNGEYGTDFFRCVCWRGLAERVAEYKDKGDWIEVMGQLSQRSYNNTVGDKIWITEVMCKNINFPLIGERRNKKPKDDLPAIIGSGNNEDNYDKDDDYDDDLPF
jgi:single-strand DNA-binding protein